MNDVESRVAMIAKSLGCETYHVGAPDFLVVKKGPNQETTIAMIEVKSPTDKLHVSQQKWLENLRGAGISSALIRVDDSCRDDDLREAIATLLMQPKHDIPLTVTDNPDWLEHLKLIKQRVAKDAENQYLRDREQMNSKVAALKTQMARLEEFNERLIRQHNEQILDLAQFLGDIFEQVMFYILEAKTYEEITNRVIDASEILTGRLGVNQVKGQRQHWRRSVELARGHYFSPLKNTPKFRLDASLIKDFVLQSRFPASQLFELYRQQSAPAKRRLIHKALYGATHDVGASIGPRPHLSDNAEEDAFR